MSSSGLNNFVYVPITKYTFEEHEISVTKTTVLIWKWKNHFIQLHNLVHDFWKKHITRCMFLHRSPCMNQKSQGDTENFFWTLKLSLYGLVVVFKKYMYLNVNMYLLTEEGRSFKTFLKENYGIALDNCYLFTKKMLNMELKMTSTYGYIKYCWNLQQIWWIPCNLSRWRIWQSVSL